MTKCASQRGSRLQKARMTLTGADSEVKIAEKRSHADLLVFFFSFVVSDSDVSYQDEAPFYFKVNTKLRSSLRRTFLCKAMYKSVLN